MVEHPILLRGLGALNGGAPVILQRTDQQLIPALLAQLQAGELESIGATVARSRGADGLLTFYPPVQRTFYVALFEAVCLTPGLPRLDPQAIESAGIVVRRQGSRGREGWLMQQSILRGWVHLPDDAAAQDPDPSRRRRLSAGHATIDRALALRRALMEPLAEQAAPLFVAPPALCAALGKTVLYGMVPVTSGEFGEMPGGASTPALDGRYAALVAGHLPNLLRAGQAAFPLAGKHLSAADVAPERLGDSRDLRTFTAILRQIALEYDAFGSTAQAQALMAALNEVTLDLPGGGRTPMGDFLRRATEILVEGASSQVTMPVAWPELSSAQAQKIANLILSALTARLVEGQQGERRFAQPGATYEARGFVRVNRAPQCPPELVWSEYSEPYTIAPWYAPAETGLPLPQIDLPDPFDRNALRQLKPSVAFRVPEKLFGVMNNMDPASVMDGKRPADGDGFGLDWLCSFNLPIITICAFLVLNIFLSLFDIVFRWMLFIKVCIPMPKRE
jgi:hypothetical protein